MRISFVLDIVITVALILLYPLSAMAMKATLQGSVVQVKDGDTVVISPEEGGAFFTCRLYGIDSPEGSQQFGREATEAMKDLVLGRSVVIVTTGEITHNREVCLIRAHGADINLEMIRRGYAWAYIRHLKDPYTRPYTEAERSARKQGLGLWRDPSPEAPWDYRRRQQDLHGISYFNRK